jgi:hypothetical protein
MPLSPCLTVGIEGGFLIIDPFNNLTSIIFNVNKYLSPKKIKKRAENARSNCMKLDLGKS